MQVMLTGAFLVGLGGAAAGGVAAWSLRSEWHRRGQDVARLPLRSLLSLPVGVAGGWVLVASSVTDSAAAPAALLFVVLAAALAWIDLDVHRLPDLLVLGGAAAITALLVAAAATTNRWDQLGVAAAAAGVMTVVFPAAGRAGPGDGAGI